MRSLITDITNVGEVHKTFAEWCADVSLEVPNPDIWWYNYADDRFFCILAKHGKKVVGMSWGRVEPYYSTPKLSMEGFFVRRGFRKTKFIKSLCSDTKKYVMSRGIAKWGGIRK